MVVEGELGQAFLVQALDGEGLGWREREGRVSSLWRLMRGGRLHCLHCQVWAVRFGAFTSGSYEH